VHAGWLADAIDDGLSGRRRIGQALAGYAGRRDQKVLPMYEFTCVLAPFARPPRGDPRSARAVRRDRR
jgi:hypothetical protein